MIALLLSAGYISLNGFTKIAVLSEAIFYTISIIKMIYAGMV